MRCPKCQYIGFDGGDRCRNCGYEFVLASIVPGDEELPLRRDEVVGPPDDFALRSATTPVHPGSGPRQPRGAGAAVADLPLFNDSIGRASDAAPIVEPGATRHPPLAVRRSPEEPPRRRLVRAGATQGDPDLAAFVSEQDAGTGEMSRRTGAAARPGKCSTGSHRPAPLSRRGIAGAIDLAILATIDLAVVYFTLRLTGLDFASVTRLPLLPLLGFLVLLGGGYLVGFTAASGQTIGKMLTGVRVVGEGTERVPLGSAVVRAAAYGLSVFPFGLGCLPAVFSPDRCAVHDRLAHTRVVAV